MTLNQIKSFKWTDKISVSKTAAYAAGLGAALLILFFRLKPYFADKITVKSFSRERATQRLGEKTQDGQRNHQIVERDLNDKPKANQGTISELGTNAGPASLTRIIERPLFDGRTVILKAALLQNLSSKQAEEEIEAKLLRDGDLLTSFDSSMLEGAILIGTAIPNFETKRYDLRFSMLLTQLGRRYSISAYAVEGDSYLTGVPAQYSSGLGSRLAGAALSSAIQLGQDIATAKIIDASGASPTVIAQQANSAIVDAGRQGGNELSDETTKDLRNTQAELSLPAGTVFTLQLRAADKTDAGGFR